MQRAPLAAHQQERVAAGLPFVESLARRMASTMPHSIDLGDLVQDGVLGLIDAAHRLRTSSARYTAAIPAMVNVVLATTPNCDDARSGSSTEPATSAAASASRPTMVAVNTARAWATGGPLPPPDLQPS